MVIQQNPIDPGRLAECLERVQSFRLLDDEFMSKVFEDRECAALLLRVILDKEDLEVRFVESQCTFKNLQGHSTRLDIYATDRDGRIYDIEVQRNDKGAAARRARYYSSLIDADILNPGESYENLAEKYVIFITENDVLGRGLPIYHIERTILETGELFNDASHMIYVNAQITDDATALGRLMHDFWCTRYEDICNPVLADRVRRFKTEEKGANMMSKAVEDMFNRWHEEDLEKMTETMLADGKLTHEDIARYTRQTVEDVDRIAARA